MKKYTYKNKKTGKTIQSDTPLKDKELVLVSAIRDVKIKAGDTRTK